MNKLEEIIYKNTKNGLSMFLIGQTDSGKTWFIENSLIPYFNKTGAKVQFFKNAEEVRDVKPETDLVIIDELETFQDLEYLKQKYSEEQPYYSDSYVKRVGNWFRILKNIKNTCLYVLSRNDQEDINFLANFCHFTDWDNRKVVPLIFSKEMRIK